MAGQKLNRAVKTVSSIFIVLVLIAVIGGIVFLTRGGKEDIKKFSMKIGDKYILRDESGIELKNGDKITVNSSDEYTVAVYAYSDKTDFDIKYGDELLKWSDLTAKDFLKAENCGLVIDKQKDGFTLSFGSLKSIIGIDKEVEIYNDVSGDMFRLAVTSNDSTINVYFGIGNISADTTDCSVTDIVIDPDEVVF